MPTVKGKVQKTKITDGHFMCLLVLNGKLPRDGEYVTLKWGSKRTLPQNALYWVFLNWLIEHAELKDQGHFCPDALHANLKAHFLQEKILEKDEYPDKELATTTLLNKSEFSEYFEKVDHFMQEFFEIDTSPFWEEHKENHT